MSVVSPKGLLSFHPKEIIYAIGLFLGISNRDLLHFKRTCKSVNVLFIISLYQKLDENGIPIERCILFNQRKHGSLFCFETVRKDEDRNEVLFIKKAIIFHFGIQTGEFVFYSGQNRKLYTYVNKQKGIHALHTNGEHYITLNVDKERRVKFFYRADSWMKMHVKSLNLTLQEGTKVLFEYKWSEIKTDKFDVDLVFKFLCDLKLIKGDNANMVLTPIDLVIYFKSFSLQSFIFSDMQAYETMYNIKFDRKTQMEIATL